MKFLLPAKIAGRYLTSKKSHSAVSAIATVSVVGVAVATAAIICVLSVFNGFGKIIMSASDRILPDIMITPAAGKTIPQADSIASVASAVAGVEEAMPSIAEQALALHDGYEMPIILKGVKQEPYSKITNVPELIADGGSYILSSNLPEGRPRYEYDEEMEMYFEVTDTMTYFALPAIGSAAHLGTVPGSKLLIFAPRREGAINMADPVTSFLSDSVTVAATIQSDRPEFDSNTIIVDIDLARRLLQYSDEASAIELKIADNASADAIAADLSRRLGKGFIIKNRLQQQEINFHMVEIEKWITFLLLSFILLIASFNCISTLSMLVLEKEKSLSTLSAIGMRHNAIASIFAWESLYVTMIGFFAGAAIGLGLCLLQEHFGLLRFSGDSSQMLVSAYPVVVKWTDLVAVCIPTLLIGTLTAWVTARFARSRISSPL